MAMQSAATKQLNLHQRLAEVAKICGVLRKDKAAYGFKYVEESAIQAALTAGLNKYGVLLTHDIVPGTLKVTPHTYEKYDAKMKANKTITEFIVQADTTYSWINIDNPEDRIDGTYSMIGMQEDPSMAFGSAETYCNRYYLLKMLQIATTEDDPDNWRSKQKEAADAEENQRLKEEAAELAVAVKAVVNEGTALIKSGVPKETMMEIVSKFNDGNGNPSSIKTKAQCAEIINAFHELKAKENKEEK